MNKKVLDGTEVDVQVLKEEEEEDEENLQSERFQKWEVLPESFISRKSCYKKRRLEWMKIRSLCQRKEKYLEVSHCGKLLTVQGELITKKCCKNLAHMVSTKSSYEY